MPEPEHTITEPALLEQQEFYNDIWRQSLQVGKEQRSNLETNLEFLAEPGRLKRGDKILEIGCGIGALVGRLAEQGHDVTGCDLSNEAVRYGREKFSDVCLEVQPAEELSYPDKAFDVVLSFDLFEHIAAVDRHISEVVRVLKPGGRYLFQTPNKLSNVVFELLSQRCFKWQRNHPSLHSPRQLQKRMERYGFDIRFVKMNAINEFAVLKLKRFGMLGRMIGKIDFTKLPLGLQTNLYVIATRDSQRGCDQ